MKKKLMSSVMLAAMVFGGAAVPVFAADSDTSADDTMEIAIYEAADDDAIVGVPVITVGDTEVDLSQLNVTQYIYDEDGTIMVPLRVIAEQMGYTVSWDNDTRSIVVADDDWEVSMAIGTDSYSGVSKTAIGMTAPLSYGQAPQIIDGTTYVPADMFELMGYTCSSVGQFVNFSTDV